MTFPADDEDDALAALLDAMRAFEAASDAPVGGADAAGAAAELGEAQRRVRTLASLGVVKAAFDRVVVRQIAGLDRARSLEPESDPVRAGGHRDTAWLLAELWRTSLGNARQLCEVARATAPRYSLTGEELPPEFPAFTDALLRSGDSGVPEVSVEQVSVSVRELEKTGDGCSREDRVAGEHLLVEQAPGCTVEDLRRLAVKVRDRLDADGTEPREQIQRRRRALTITTTREGLTHIDWYLDPESAGYVVPQITAYVSGDFHDTRNQGDSRDGKGAEAPDMPATRSMDQLRSDGAVEVFRHRAGCTREAPRPPVTMIVRVSLADLKSGIGSAEIDEVGSPISAATARRLAADAHLIPMVLGRNSEVLDLGRKKRLFSPAQKHALAERDGGCAWTGCPHPPSYTQAHHIRWWDRDKGATDLNNGILLCSQHHHRVHDDGWDIHVRDNIPWFTPPAHLDPTRTPRRGGRIRHPGSAPP
jgi:hypothetical protein